MADYRVAWEIDVEAESPRQAAEEALKIQREPQSTTTVFKVFGQHYDPPAPSNFEVIDLGSNASRHGRQADMDAHACKELGERLLAWKESRAGGKPRCGTNWPRPCGAKPSRRARATNSNKGADVAGGPGCEVRTMLQEMIVPRVSDGGPRFALVKFSGVAREGVLPRLTEAMSDWAEPPRGAELLEGAEDDFNVGDLSRLDLTTLRPKLRERGITHLEVEVYGDSDRPDNWTDDTPLLG
jgi:hypothetical protein